MLSLALAHGAAPAIPYFENPIIFVISIVLFVSCVMILVPPICDWGWEAKYFGTTVVGIGSVALLFLVPCLSLVLWGNPPVIARIFLFSLLIAIHLAWCRRLVTFYRRINSDTESYRLIYQEEHDAVYYMQRGDIFLLEKRNSFNQIPKDRYFALFLLTSFFLVPFMDAATAQLGIPFVHIFLIVGALPVSLMAVGIATRGWLVFYFYPMQIKKLTGKRVYVDLSGRPDVPRTSKRKKAT